MKIALALDGNVLSGHFGHCEKFLICHIENQQITTKEVVKNPCHYPSEIPGFLKDQGVVEVIVGGIGGGAIDMLKEEGIDSIRVEIVDTEEIVNNYLSGKLKDLGSKCDGKFR